MLSKILDIIKTRNPKKIAIQLPEGLKSKAFDFIKEIEKKIGAEVVVLADSCFGSCDLRDSEAKALGCDLLIHVGHSDIGIKTALPTYYIEYKSDLDIKKVLEKSAGKISEQKIGIVTTVQHLHKLEEAEKILEKHNKKIFIGKGSRAKHSGQVLGCDFKAATSIANTVDCFLFIGTGNFHPLGIAFTTSKPVYIADPEKNEFRPVEELKDKILRQRFAKIEKAKNANKFGVILSLKKGQRREKLAEELKKKIEQAGKMAVILALDELSPEKLLGFRLDCYVNTACPRLPTDDSALYEKPILTPVELEIVLGIRDWKDYELDSF